MFRVGISDSPAAYLDYLSSDLFDRIKALTFRLFVNG